MTAAPAILDRKANERAERHEARVVYLTAGADRSQEATAQQCGKSVGLIRRWSAEDGWVEQARAYDTAMAEQARAAHADQYMRDLEQHRADVRSRAEEMDRLLDGLQIQIAKAVTGQRIEGKDGKIYHIPAIEITTATVSVLLKGRMMIADMRAHALDLDRLMPALTPEGADDA